MSTLTTQEINHLIAVKVNGWVHDESVFYHDASGVTQYLADYCNSIAHALDLAKGCKIALAPTEDGWIAYEVARPDTCAEDTIPGKAICLCVLKMIDSFKSQEPVPESVPLTDAPAQDA